MKRLLYAGLLLAAISCKKDKDEDVVTTTPTREQLVGTYLQTAELTDGVNTWTTAEYEPCEMDDTYSFNADGTFVQTDAGSTCTGGGGSFTGDWTINGSTLSINGFGATVLRFDGRTLVVRSTENINGTNTVTDITFTKQ
ncbi:MAG: hypothetical protein EOO11_05185 [Chitinophagaceae bacterium]|nr:MAG: hypothetical protein EOO11_05185 [Chitinophagaceae bacterium]